MEPALRTRALRRTFGTFVAVDGIDLEVPRGSFYGFLGPNGAGKSTTIKCVTGLLRPTSGTIEILGIDPLADPVAARRVSGVVPEDLALFDRLTGAETLTFVGRMHGMDAKVIAARGAELLDLMELGAAAADLVADYSHGMRKKLALSAALLPAPRILFLDEPFEGVDAISSRQIKDLLQSFVKRGGTVFLTSHVLEVVQGLADHVGIIHEGRLVAQAPLSELLRGSSLEALFLELVGATDAPSRGLEWLSG